MPNANPKAKAPSPYTVAAQNALRQSLPFDDKRDFEEAKKGFVAAPPFTKIMTADGRVAWDMDSYAFLQQGKAYDSINPSLQRQAELNMGYGLYEVVPGRIWQIRGFDIANISFVKGKTGWIVIDAGTCEEPARAALAFINEKLGPLPVVALIYSHSHVDHFGGARGIVSEADVQSGKVPVIAPVGFMEHAISENVYAGTAMSRRARYQYGRILPIGPDGHVDQAIGKNSPKGTTGLIAPTREIVRPIEEMTIDGVPMVFQNTPGTEAPAEFNIYFPQDKAFMAAENICATIHNIYTLRGALVRDALEWSKKINEALYRFGGEAEVMFTVHNWPRFGNARIREVMRTQRDTYAYLNNSVLQLANRGVTINEVQNVFALPESLKKQWAAHSYHGSEAHNSRAVINRYLGYWDANPATLDPLSPRESAPLYVEMMGGSAKILAKGKELYDQGKYREVMEIVNKLVYAEPGNQPAKDLLADAFEQYGYQMESTSLRNSYLAAAYELRYGMPANKQASTASPDVLRAMPTELLLDYLGVRLDTQKAAGQHFVLNLVTPDNGEKFAVELSNAALTNIKGFVAPQPDATLTINRADLLAAMVGKASFADLVKSGKATLAGDGKPLEILKTAMVQFDPDFEIMPGTAPKAAPDGAK